MTSQHPAPSPLPPAITRLAALGPLGAADLAALKSAAGNVVPFRARREILREGQPIAKPSVLLSGWACRTHTLLDGRRQIISFILPGDLIGMSWHSFPVAPCSILALTDAATFAAPAPASVGKGSGLPEVYALSSARDEAYLLRNITRLGRLSAYERIADLLLEMHERLAMAGLTVGNTFRMPLTQETLADALGLTTVHVNRTIQSLRQDGMLSVGGGTVVLNDLERLAELADRRRTPVVGG